MNPVVSVIIPTYRHEAYVLKALDSVFAQTFADYEVIVVNDGSPDDATALLRPQAAHGRIRSVEQANRGQAAARSCGIAEARGEFIALLDDDDLWPPDKLEWQVSAHASAPDSVVVYGPAECIDGRGALVGPGVSGRRQFCWMGPDLVSWRTADAGVFRY